MNLPDGYTAQVTEQLFDVPALMLRRATSTDVLIKGKVLRLDPSHPERLDNLESATFFGKLEPLENICPIGRQKRSPIPLICFTKRLYDFRSSIDQRRVQAIEHIRLTPAPSVGGATRKLVYQRRIHEAIPDVARFDLTPTPLQQPLVYRPLTTGRFVAEPQFGLPGDELDALLARETAVVELQDIVEHIDDQRVLRGLMLQITPPGGPVRTHFVVEADAGVFYETTPGATGQSLAFNLREYGETPEFSQLIDAYNVKKSAYLAKTDKVADQPLVVLPTLETLYRQLARRGFSSDKIERLRSKASTLNTLKQRELLLNASDQGRKLDIHVVTKPIQLEVWPPRPNTPNPGIGAINQHLAESANRSTQRMIDRTGLKSSNVAGATLQEIRRVEAAEPVVMWTSSKIGQPDYTEIILKTGAGNCDQMAHVAHALIRQNGGRSERWCIRGAHAFVVVGTPPAASTLNFREPGWADVWISDPWVDIACPAQDYMHQLNTKMIEWHLQDINVFFKDGNSQRWGGATDPVWTRQLNDNEKLSIEHWFP